MRLNAPTVAILFIIGTPWALLSTTLAADEADLLREAETKVRQQRYAEAVELASRAIEQDREMADAYRLRAAAYEALRRFIAAIADLDRSIELRPDVPGAYQGRGELHFRVGQIRASIADFDRFLDYHPERRPHHWQRGISYYYAGEYEKGVGQFELHKTVNPEDVENAVWHYLCKSQVDGVDQARAALIDIATDNRQWAMKVYRMFQGKVAPAQVLSYAEEASRTEAERRNNMFYAHLYIGLFHEAAGRMDEANKHIKIAVNEYPSSHYMGDVARVHLQLRTAK